VSLEVAQVLAALADPTRRAIVESVRRQPRAVNDIARQFDVSRSAVSQHLRVLEDAGLLRSQRDGRHNFYGVDMTGLGVLRKYVESFWDDVLGAFHAAALEASSQRRKGRR
jgi:DNA-binding transcriptional ArsR family regulator